MTKEVLISISGLQMMDGADDQVEIITAGEYYLRDGKHYILYEEIIEGFSGSTKNMIKIQPGYLEIVKKGSTNTKMEFAADEKKVSTYLTPYGELLVGIHTRQIVIKESADQLQVVVDYALDINYEHVSDCHIVMGIQSKSIAELKLS